MQRVTRAHVAVEGEIVAAIGQGLCVLLGVGTDDSDVDARYIADKVAGLRIFRDDDDLMNHALRDAGGSVLLISQFTLHGDVRKGRRPSCISAAREDIAAPLYERTGRYIEAHGVSVGYGVFGAHMELEIVNDGPVTILVDSKRVF